MATKKTATKKPAVRKTPAKKPAAAKTAKKPAAKKVPAKKPAPAASKITFEELALRVIEYINSNGNYSAACKDGEISIKIGSSRLYWYDAYCFLAAEEVPDGNGGDRPTLNVIHLIRRWNHKWDRVGQAQRNFVKKCEKLLRHNPMMWMVLPSTTASRVNNFSSQDFDVSSNTAIQPSGRPRWSR